MSNLIHDSKISLLQVFILLFLSLFIFLVVEISDANELVNLPLDSRIYSFLERLSVKGIITDNKLGNSLPVTRRQVILALLEVKDKLSKGEVKLTEVEKKELNRYVWLSGNEISSLDSDYSLTDKREYLITVRDKDYRFDFSPKFGQGWALTNENRDYEFKDTSISYIGTTLMGKLGKKFALINQINYHFLWGNIDYNPYPSEMPNGFKSDNKRSQASMEAYAVIHFPLADIEIGKDDLWWGPGKHGTLLISDNSDSKDLFKLLGSYGPVKFSSVTCILDEAIDKRGSKYLSAHRVEITPFSWLNFGIYEAVVYSERLELRYVNPFILQFLLGWEFEEEGDNKLNGFDFDLNLFPNFEVYGEVMIDDLQLIPGGFEGLRRWSTKFGILYGFYWTDTFGLKDSDFQCEYAFINQYAYTHRDNIHKYTHRERVIGHFIGNDADNLWIQFKHRFTERLQTSISYELERHGEGDVNTHHVGDSSERWEFLSGIAESNHSVSLGILYNLIGKYSVEFEYSHSWIKNADNQKSVNKTNDQVLMRAKYSF